MERTEAPTEDRINELRAQGITPLSLLSLRIAALILFSFSLYLIGLQAFSDLSALLTGIIHRQITFHQAVQSTSSTVAQLLVVPALVVLFGVLLFGLCQTRFLFLLSRVEFNLANLWPLSKPNLVERKKTLVKTFVMTIIITLLASSLSASLFYIFSSELLRLMYQPQQFVGASFLKLLHILFPVFIAISVIITLLSWLITRTRFMLRYRMSRAEIEQEAKSK